MPTSRAEQDELRSLELSPLLGRRGSGARRYPQTFSLPLDPLPGGSAPRNAALRFSQPGAGFARLPRNHARCYLCARSEVLLACPGLHREETDELGFRAERGSLTALSPSLPTSRGVKAGSEG